MNKESGEPGVGVLPTLVNYMKLDAMNLKPYKFHLWHKLEEKDFEKILFFAHWLIKLPKSTHEYITCSDESYFYLTFLVKNQNNRQWSKSLSYFGTETSLHD